MKCIYCFFLLFAGLNLYSQDDNAIYNTMGLDSRPEPFNSLEAFNEFITSKIPCMEVGEKSFYSFVVEKDGTLSSLKCVRSGIKNSSEDCNEKIINAFNTAPKWTPGKVSGRNVRVSYSLPIMKMANETINVKQEEKTLPNNKSELDYYNSLVNLYNEKEFNDFKVLFPNSKYLNKLNVFFIMEKEFNTTLKLRKSWDSKNTLGDVKIKQGNRIVVDSKGFIYAIGISSKTLTKRTSRLGGDEYFPAQVLVKYDSNGMEIWEKSIEVYGLNFIAIDQKDNIYLTSNYCRVAKYDIDGNILWSGYNDKDCEK